MFDPSHLISTYGQYAKANPVVAGVISLWGAGVVTFLFRHMPAKVWNGIKSQFVTELYINNSQIGSNFSNYISFLKWFENSKWSKYSRSLSINGCYKYNGSSEDNGIEVGVGDGSHFFMYKGRFCWMRRYKVENTMSYSSIYYEIKLTVLGRNRQLMLDMIKEFAYKPHANRVGIYNYRADEWALLTDVDSRSLNSVIMAQDVKTSIVETIESFHKAESWYKERGIPYKKVFLFHGIPGSGKTSLIRALATHFNTNIYRLNLTTMSDKSLEEALALVPAKSFILIEDFDSSKSTVSRDNVDIITTKTNGEESKSLLTLSGILNALDGIVALDDKIIFMTTNVLQSIDRALIRKGRVDNLIEFKALKDKEVREYIELMFPGTEVNKDIVFEDIVGCDLQDLYMQHPDQPLVFINSIPQKRTNQCQLK